MIPASSALVRGVRIAGALALVTSAAARSLGSQPSMFRGGAARTGVYHTIGVPAFGGLQWRVQTAGPVRSSPVVAGGVVYIGSSDGHVYAIGARSGAVRWKTAFGAPVTSTPAVGNGLVYVNGRDRTFRALRVADGRVAWTFRTGTDAPLAWGFESGQVYTSSPVLAGALVIFGSTDGFVYALDARTGAERWRFAAGARVYSSPAVGEGIVVVGTQRGHVIALAPTTGRERWRFSIEGAALSSADFGFDRTTVQSSPTIADGAVYVGARDGFLYALDAATGTQKWRFDHKVSWVNSSPATDGGAVFAASSDGHFVQAVDAATGTEIWRAPTVGIAWSSPALDSARVYVGENNGTLYALDRKTGAPAWTYRTGGALFSSPVVHDGRVFIGSDDGSVYAINATDGAALRRAVFWDSAHTRAPMTNSYVTARNHLVDRGYELLDAGGLARFLLARIEDRAPSTVVFALDRLPPSVAPTADDTVLFRRYLDAGGTVIWFGTPPLIAPAGMTSLKQLDRDAVARLLGVRHRRGNFDALGVFRVTAEGRAMGLPSWWLDRWGADPEDVTTVLAYDEQGQAVAWIKRFGGPPGTGFIRLFSGDGSPGRPASLDAIRTAAELRPR